MNAKIQDVLFRKLQSQAFLNAKEKADVFLEIFGEHSGKLLELSEINASVSYPSNTFDGKTKNPLTYPFTIVDEFITPIIVEPSCM